MESKNKLKSNEDFFNSISGFYDGMVNFAFALQKRKSLINRFISDKTKTAADLGCGTGLDSIALAMNGISVSGFDISEEMIKKAKVNASSAGLKIDFHKSSLENIPSSFHGKFDLILSLGNTLANIDGTKLTKVIDKISKLLSENGKLVIQVLNYAKLIKDNERILNVNSTDDEMMVRFYDFLPANINFNILKINLSDYSKRELYTTVLYPHTKETFSHLLEENNLKNIEYYGSLNLLPYQEDVSQDLIITAVK